MVQYLGGKHTDSVVSRETVLLAPSKFQDTGTVKSVMFFIRCMENIDTVLFAQPIHPSPSMPAGPVVKLTAENVRELVAKRRGASLSRLHVFEGERSARGWLQRGDLRFTEAKARPKQRL